jgi:Flp pilus assembly protein TadG
MDDRAARGRWRATSGQGVVEFSLVSLTLCLIIFGTIDLGRAVFLRSMLTNAVREAARNGSIYPSDGSAFPNTNGTDGIVAAAQHRSPSLTLSSSNFTVRCLTPGGATQSCLLDKQLVVGGFLQVCATYTYNSALTHLLPIPPVNMGECSRIAIH